MLGGCPTAQLCALLMRACRVLARPVPLWPASRPHGPCSLRCPQTVFYECRKCDYRYSTNN